MTEVPPFSDGQSSDGASTDSAGQPWSGRTLPNTGFAGDDGAADRRLDDVLAQFAAGDATAFDVQRVLVDVRIIVPVVAQPTEVETDDAGLTHEKSTDMATVVLVGEDGRKGLLAFGSTARMTEWNADARPVPVEAAKAAAAALDDECDALLVDLGGPYPFVIEGALLRALSQSRPWVRPADDEDVVAAIREAFAPEQGVWSVEITEGDTTDVTVLIKLREDVPAEALDGLGERVGGRLAENDVLRDRLANGLDVRIVPLDA